MTEYYRSDKATLYLADCLDAMREMAENSVDAIVCDPPYMLGFMGKAFDDPKDNPAASPVYWKEALRVLKPGGHLLAFGGTRTHHRMMCAIEDAGFEVRDVLMWLHGQGFPKSLDVSKAIDKAAGVERQVVAHVKRNGGPIGMTPNKGWHSSPDAFEKDDGFVTLTAPATDAARTWDGWGTALKPAWEPIILARKPLSEPNVAANVLRWGTGGVNVGACRVGAEQIPLSNHNKTIGGNGKYGGGVAMQTGGGTGRWPANLVLDEEAAAMLDAQSGSCGGRWGKHNGQHPDSMFWGKGEERTDDIAGRCEQYIGDTGGASRFYATFPADATRFFYTAKASRREREAGCEGMEKRAGGVHDDDAYRQPGERKSDHTAPLPTANHHPTVKPLTLMRWLCRLITPPNGIILDPFLGSGSTGCAAVREGFRFIGIEREPDYIEIARRRIAHWAAEDTPLLAGAKR